jgi:cullin-associated NEDD8-dissociated protein 1
MLLFPQARLRDPAPSVRATVISALRYTFIDSARSYDELLGPVIIDFLSLIQDQDLVSLLLKILTKTHPLSQIVQQLALSALNSAARNKPHLIIDHLSVLVPALYSETMVKSDLVEIVEMGPWKHKVDKGVDARKAAFETMYTLVSICYVAALTLITIVSYMIAG